MGSRGCTVGNLLAEEDKEKVGIRGYIHMGPLILALDSFYGLTSNFIICFVAISSSFPTFNAFPTCGQALTLGSWNFIRFLLSQGSVLGHLEL
jgi:hypothetical protein